MSKKQANNQRRRKDYAQQRKQTHLQQPARQPMQQTAGVLDILTPVQTKSLIIVLVLGALLELMAMQALLPGQILQRGAGPAPRGFKDARPNSPDKQEQSYKERPEGSKKAAGKDTRQKQDWRMCRTCGKKVYTLCGKHI